MAHQLQDSSGILSLPSSSTLQQNQQPPLLAFAPSNDDTAMSVSAAEETQNDKIAALCELDMGRSAIKEPNEDSVLEVKKKRLLEELESALLPKDEFSAEKTQTVQQDSLPPIRPSFGIEVIDETALVETVPASGTGTGKKTSKKKETDVVKNGKQQSRRRAKAAKLALGMGGTGMEEGQDGNNNNNGIKRKYSRKEMEALRFVNMVEQRKFWKAIYSGLDTAVAKEYNNLASSEHQKHIRLDYDPRQCFAKKKQAPAVLSAVCCENMDNELQLMESSENMSPIDPSCSHGLTGDDGCSIVEECSEDGDSEDDYASIQRPAFLVKGEPNFDSGPPEDGWEYLRRVRWEADQIPKVKVAKLDRSILNKEQSAYMPKILDIAKCPEHLLPLKQWEDLFLAEFSALRASLLCLEGSDAIDQPTILTAEDRHTTLPLENPRSKTTIDQTTSCSPTPPLLSAIFRMDTVARVSRLNKQIRLLEPVNTISTNDCMWLFALCATVDAPLDADTCAALRSLLRKCASIRAGKAELDEEVIMLNILATISGRYFGQSES